MRCNICAGGTTYLSKAIVLGRHEVTYYRCPNCGFVQTEEPYWLGEAYCDAITRSDIGLVGRNLVAAATTQATIELFFDARTRFLDYGGGYGLFVRMMRDRGFDFYRFDKHCANLFAQGFDADVKPGGGPRYGLVTAFEVFEHLVQPVEELKAMLQLSRNVLFSTTLLPSPTPAPGEWWYYGLEHGQHVALYTPQALALLAERFRLRLYTDGHSLHLLTEKRLSPALFKLVARRAPVLSPILARIRRRRSLLGDDYLQLTGRLLR